MFCSFLSISENWTDFQVQL